MSENSPISNTVFPIAIFAAASDLVWAQPLKVSSSLLQAAVAAGQASLAKQQQELERKAAELERKEQEFQNRTAGTATSTGGELLDMTSKRTETAAGMLIHHVWFYLLLFCLFVWQPKRTTGPLCQGSPPSSPASIRTLSWISLRSTAGSARGCTTCGCVSNPGQSSPSVFSLCSSLVPCLLIHLEFCYSLSVLMLGFYLLAVVSHSYQHLFIALQTLIYNIKYF